MGVFVKLVSLAAVLCVGSVLMLGLLVAGHVVLAWAALAGTAVLTGGVIWLIARETRSTDRAPR